MSQLSDDSALRGVIARVPILAEATELTVSVLLGGLSNITYLVVADGVECVVRITGHNGEVLGIDREREAVIARRAADAGIGPEILDFFLPEGHSVTRYLADAHRLSESEFASADMIPRIAARLKQVHQLNPVDGVFDPYKDIARWLVVVDEVGTPRPQRLRPLLQQVARIERSHAVNRVVTNVLCHNDTFYRNYLDDGTLWLIDWEFAAMGDPLYDLAGVSCWIDSASRDLLLREYFGHVDPTVRQHLDDLVAVYLCWCVVWSLVQIGETVIDVNFQDLAQEYLDMAEQSS